MLFKQNCKMKPPLLFIFKFIIIVKLMKDFTWLIFQ
jgi:hypothetical protein